jgi:hypothetical protein
VHRGGDACARFPSRSSRRVGPQRARDRNRRPNDGRRKGGRSDAVLYHRAGTKGGRLTPQERLQIAVGLARISDRKRAALERELNGLAIARERPAKAQDLRTAAALVSIWNARRAVSRELGSTDDRRCAPELAQIGIFPQSLDAASLAASLLSGIVTVSNTGTGTALSVASSYAVEAILTA